MRALLLTTALGAAFALSVPAFAQDASTPPAADAAAPAPKHMAKPMGGGGASNISQSDTHSEIAPKLPMPMVGTGAGANAYLKAAKMALARKRTGEAQQSLEMAETRLLNRSTEAGAQGADTSVRVQHISAALQAIAGKDMAAANSAIDAAMEGAPADAAPAPMSHKMMKKMKRHMKKDGPPPPTDGSAPPDGAPTSPPGSPPPAPPPG